MEPNVTPEVTGGEECCRSRTTFMLQLEKNDSIILKTFRDKPNEESLGRSPACNTLLKTFDMSRTTALASPPPFNAR